VPTNVPVNILVNRDRPPFDNLEIRRAMALSLDRQAYIDIISGGKASIGGNMMPPPQGVWGMPNEMLMKLPGYSPDVAAQQGEARRIMERAGYGPGRRLKLKVSTRDFATYRDPAVIFEHSVRIIDAHASISSTRFTSMLSWKSSNHPFGTIAWSRRTTPWRSTPRAMGITSIQPSPMIIWRRCVRRTSAPSMPSL
jgi:ABC-type transport system substrate-binding protein